MVYIIQVCWQVASRIRTELDPSWSCTQVASKPVWRILLLCIQWKTPDDGHRNCTKHVEFYTKNKFEKLVHLDCFIKRIFHNAQSPERHYSLHDLLYFILIVKIIFMLYFKMRRSTRRKGFQEWCLSSEYNYINTLPLVLLLIITICIDLKLFATWYWGD